MTKFADQLYEDLLREHGATLRSMSDREPAAAGPARAHRRVARPAWLTTAGLATAAAAVAGGFVLFGGAATPAYAVTQNSDGTLSVSVKQASAIAAADAELKAIGVRVVVVPVGPGCPSLGPFPVRGPGQVQVSVQGTNGQVGSITVDAKGVPADDTLVLGFDGSRGGLFGGSGLIKGKAPTCVSLPAPPARAVPAGGSGRQSGGGQVTSGIGQGPSLTTTS